MRSRVYVTVQHLSVPARAHSSKPTALGLTGAISQLLSGAQQQQRANAGSVMLSAYVGS